MAVAALLLVAIDTSSAFAPSSSLSVSTHSQSSLQASYLEDETDRMFARYDADDSGTIDRDEFNAVVQEMKLSSRREMFSVTSAAISGIFAATATNTFLNSQKTPLEFAATSTNSFLGVNTPKVPAMTESDVQQLFQLWNAALLTGDSDAVARRYSKDAVLLPTVSDIPRTTYAGIKDYFDHFLLLKPEGKIIESYIDIGQYYCKDVGIYEFTKGTDGSVVRARYSFVYVYEDGEWKISHHHSSLMPEKLLADAAANKASNSQ